MSLTTKLREFLHRCVLGLRQGAVSVVAAFCAFIPAHLIGLQQAFWSAITAIAVAQMEFVNTRTLARRQATGAAIGGVIGLCMIVGFGDHLLVYFVAVLLSVLACWLLDVGDSSQLGGVTATIIMLVPHAGSPEAMAVSRISEVGWGVCVGIAVAWVVDRLANKDRLNSGWFFSWKRIITRSKPVAKTPEENSMHSRHNPKLRFGMSLREAESAFSPSLPHGPALPAIDFALVGKAAPTLTPTPAQLPKADTVVICWAEAEWAALQHVFCGGATAMPYSARSKNIWPGWVKYAENLPKVSASGWEFWGYYRLVEIAGSPVLLWKSNTHLDFPGATTLAAMIKLLISQVQPSLILSTGTAGGAIPADHIGTVRAVSAGTLFETGKPAADWPDYSNGWTANTAVLDDANFAKLLFPIPITSAELQNFGTAFNQHYNTNLTQPDLDPDGLNLGDAVPVVADQTGGATALLTTSTFVVGTTAGTYADYAAIEMDDAIIGETCKASSVAFGFVRNISDPAQNAALPVSVQGSWGSAIYDACGFYTSYNGALAAWAILAAG